MARKDPHEDDDSRDDDHDGDHDEEDLTILGARPARYDLLVNVDPRRRFEACPLCFEKLGRADLNIFALLPANEPLLFQHNGPLCPSCELFIIHEHELEAPPEIREGLDFVGTIDADFARRCEDEARPIGELLEHLADFQSFIDLEEAAEDEDGEDIAFEEDD